MWNLCPAVCQDLTKYFLDKLKGKAREGFLTSLREPTWHVILEPGKLKQEDYNFEISLGIQQVSVLFCFVLGLILLLLLLLNIFLKKYISIHQWIQLLRIIGTSVYSSIFLISCFPLFGKTHIKSYKVFL